MNTYYKTHDTFFKILTKRKLNELYRRVSENILENDINSRINNYYCRIVISNKCHIFINIYNILNIKIGHISLHIESENKYLSNRTLKIGRFHAKNNILNKSYTLKINNMNNKTISYNSEYINSGLEYVINIIINVLNEYFNKQSIRYLGYYDKNYIHPCTKIIKKKITLKNTYKK